MKNFLRKILPTRSTAEDVDALFKFSENLIAQVRAKNLSYCGRPKLENLSEAAIRLRCEKVPGAFIEAGVALGGSAIVLAKLKEPSRRLDLYDVFSMIPPPGPRDGQDAHKRYAEIKTGGSAGLGGEMYYGYIDKLIDQVRLNLESFNINLSLEHVSLIQGLFEDTLYPQGAIALAHIDCDWYEPVRTCIDRIVPKLSAGGIIVFDDYSSYSGCTRAVDELLAQRTDFEKVFHNRSLGIRLKP